MNLYKLARFCFLFFLSYLARILFSFRYRIEIRGFENFPQKIRSDRGILFLPNHSAFIDNAFLMAYLWPKFQIQPLAGDKFQYAKISAPLIRLVGALCIPNFENSTSPYKIRKAQEVLEQIQDCLKAGKSMMLSPAGHTKKSAKEQLKGAIAAHTLVTALPEVNVVLIRVTGLWGSSFSRAITGKSPDLPNVLRRNLKTLLKNGLFFTPRRHVRIELEPNPADLPRASSKAKFNQYLENWYNRYPEKEEPLKLVSYSFWKNQTLPIKNDPEEEKGEEISLAPEIQKTIFSEIQKIADQSERSLNTDLSLTEDLRMDSLNIAELVAYLSRQYNIKELDLSRLKTVRDVFQIVQGAEQSTLSGDFRAWPSEPQRPAVSPPPASTVLEAFVKICKKMKKCAACRDDTVGILSYNQLQRAVFVLAEIFKTLPDSRIAVLLPSSAGAVITYFALLAAGKTPVMLNWTLGPRYLEEMIKIGQVQTIISSWRFLDKAPNIDLGQATNQVRFLEDFRQKLTLRQKIKGILSARFPQKALSKLSAEGTAVIFFTSGSERLPKCVPLSHRNVLNSSSSKLIQAFGDVQTEDVLLSFLPPFHVLGFLQSMLFPILSGIRTGFFPNPTDSRSLAQRVLKWRVSLMISAPSFLKNLLNVADAEQLKSMRIAISGGEKASSAMIQQFEHLGIQFVEGYGLTESSGVFCVQSLSLPKKGVGKLLRDNEACAIHPETQTPLEEGQEGELCIRGPSVFQGYLGSVPSPFIHLKGKLWYRTGDLGSIDAEGFISLSGRLKRFIKIGGEMISLRAIEEILENKLQELSTLSFQGPSIAVCASESGAITLFTIKNFDKAWVDDALKEGGFSNLIKISAIHHLDQIPLLGTGKTNYGKLQSQLL